LADGEQSTNKRLVEVPEPVVGAHGWQRNVNGGVFLGLNGVVVKSHGGTDALGFATSLRIALEMADSRFLSEIERNLERLSALQADTVSEGETA